MSVVLFIVKSNKKYEARYDGSPIRSQQSVASGFWPSKLKDSRHSGFELGFRVEGRNGSEACEGTSLAYSTRACWGEVHFLMRFPQRSKDWWFVHALGLGFKPNGFGC